MFDFLKKFLGNNPKGNKETPVKVLLENESVSVSAPTPIVPLPPAGGSSVTNTLPKPAFVLSIERIIKCDLSPADEFPTDELPGVRSYKENTPKYALDAQGRLIGLNLVNIDLSQEQWQQIAAIPSALDHLRILNLSDNPKLTSFEWPPALRSLHTLDLGDCGLTRFELPPGGLAPLNDLELEGNRLENIGPEVFAGGKKGVLVYLSLIDKTGTSDTLEIKLMLIGEGEAGKTTLARKLKDGAKAKSVKSKDRTEGLDVFIDFLTWDLSGDKKLCVNLFDFGGQTHYKPLHQFFYSSNSIYCLVSRGGDDHGKMTYWFGMAELYGENSPLLVVNNLKSGIASGFNRSSYPDYADLIHKKVFDVDLHHFNPDDKETNTNDREKALNDILENIKLEVSRLAADMAKKDVPKSYSEIKDTLKGQKEKRTITKEKFFEICTDSKKGDLAMTEQEAEECLKYLHNIGFCLCFSKNEDLANTIFLDHQWLTDAVYHVLADQTIKTQKGAFSDNDLKRIIEKRTTKKALISDIRRLMKEFKLYYELKKNKYRYQYLAPSLLPTRKEEYEAETKSKTEVQNAVAVELPNLWENSATDLRYEVEFNIMPPELFARFIVVMYRNIEEDASGKQLVWKDEVLFREGNTKAYARTLIQDGKARIAFRINGEVFEKKRDFLTVLQRALNEVNETRSKDNKENMGELIPCDCTRCRVSENPYFFKMARLEERLIKNKADIECEISYERLPVAYLLGYSQKHAGEKGVISPESIQALKDALAKNEIQSAIELLRGVNGDQFVLLSGEYKGYLDAFYLGTIDGTALGEKQDLIRKKILSVLDDPEQQKGKLGEARAATSMTVIHHHHAPSNVFHDQSKQVNYYQEKVREAPYKPSDRYAEADFHQVKRHLMSLKPEELEELLQLVQAEGIAATDGASSQSILGKVEAFIGKHHADFIVNLSSSIYIDVLKTIIGF